MFLERKTPRYVPFLVGGIILGLVLAAVIAAPRIVNVQPGSDTEDISPTTSILIEFTQHMNADSVEAHLDIDPFAGGTYTWEENRLTIIPEQPWMTGETVSIHLRAGARSSRLLPTLWNTTWSFQVGSPRLAYLWPAFGAANIYTTSITSDVDPVQLTFSKAGVLDFNSSLTGNLIAYTNISSEGETEIRLLDSLTLEDRVVFACDDGALCQSPTISPDGNWLAFERHEQIQGSGGKAITDDKAVWLISLEGNKLIGSVYDESHEVLTPHWSYDGNLTVFDNSLKSFVVLNPTAPSNALTFIPNSLGQMGTWSSAGDEFVYAEIIFPEELLGDVVVDEIPEGDTLFYSHLYQNNLVSGEVKDISPGPSILVEDSSPKFSPDGTRLAFARKYLDENRWTMGREIWLINPSTGQVDRITDDDMSNFSSIDWSSDGRQLAFMQSNLASTADDPIVWVWDIEQAKVLKLIEGGYLPQWIR